MRLFFETSAQAEMFLVTACLGLLLAAGFDLTSAMKRGRVLLDVLLVLFCAVSLLWLLHFMRDDGLRLYHLLALCVGALLYSLGVGRLLRLFRRWRRRSREGNCG